MAELRTIDELRVGLIDLQPHWPPTRTYIAIQPRAASPPTVAGRRLRIDGNPKEFVGFIVLLTLGIAFTGFHDGEVSQIAVSLFAKGGYDELKPKMKDFVLNTA